MKETDQEKDAATKTKPYDEQAVSSDAYPVKNYRLIGWAVVKQ